MAALRTAGLVCLAYLGTAAVAAQTTSATKSSPLTLSTGATYIRVVVQFRDGTPVGSAPIELHQLGGVLLATGVTSAGGEYKFRTKSAGPYEIHVADGGKINVFEIESGDSNQQVEITLANSGDATPTSDEGAVSSNDLAAPAKARDKLVAAGQEIVGLDFAKARKLVDEAIALAPQWGRPYFVRGLLDMDDHDYAHALDDLNIAVTDNPSNGAALAALGRLYTAMGQNEEADAELRRALALPPVLWQTYAELAHVDIMRGHFLEAADMARNALGAKPPAPLEAHLLVAQAAMGLHDWQTAAEQMRSYLNQTPDDTPLTARVRGDLKTAEERLTNADATPALAVPSVAAAEPAPPQPAVASPSAAMAAPQAPEPSPPPPAVLAPARALKVETSPIDVCGTCMRSVPLGVPLLIERWVNEVNLQVTVEDRGHQVVSGLPASDFQVFDNGDRQQLLSFAQEDAPISLGILIDSSGSMAPMRSGVNQAALNFIAGTNHDDEVFIADFADRFTLATPLTNDVASLRQGLRKTNSAGGTALYDAMLMALDYLNTAATRAKRVLLVVTDGQDDESRHTLDQMLTLLHDPNAPLVYCIGLSDAMSAMTPEGRHALAALAEASGGMAYFPREIGEVDHTTHVLSNAIRAQYTLAYKASQISSGFHRVRIEVNDTHLGALVAVTRDGYTADGN